jgi:hypothetical protein
MIGWAALLMLQAAQPPAPAQIQPPVCGDAEIAEFGLECNIRDACNIFLELAGVEEAGGRIFLSGNFHTGAATLWSLLLMSEDEGRTWTEPHPRLRGIALDDIQFVDAETGWVSGHVVGALPRDPFLLKTADGGKTWRRVPVLEESSYGAIDAFRFESRTQGVLFLQRRGEPRQRYQRWETMTGGDTWMLREAGPKPFPPLKPRPTGWRIRTDVRARQYLIERDTGKGYAAVARFPVRFGECRPDPEPAEPPPSPEAPPP